MKNYEQEYAAATAEPHKNHPTIFRLPAIILHFAFWKKDSEGKLLFAKYFCAELIEELHSWIKEKNPNNLEIIGIQECKTEQQYFQVLTKKDNREPIELCKDYIFKTFFSTDNKFGTYEIKFYPPDINRSSKQVQDEVKSKKTIYSLDCCLRLESHREYFTVSIFFYSKKASIHKSSIASQHLLNKQVGNLLDSEAVKTVSWGLKSLEKDALDPESPFLGISEEEQQEAAKILQNQIYSDFLPNFQAELFSKISDRINNNSYAAALIGNPDETIKSHLMGRYLGMIQNSRVFCTHPTWREFLTATTPDWASKSEKNAVAPNDKMSRLKRSYLIPLDRNVCSDDRSVDANTHNHFTFPEQNLSYFLENSSRFVEEITGSIDAAKEGQFDKTARDRSQLSTKLYEPKFRNSIACLMSWGDAIYISSLGGHETTKDDSEFFSEHQKPIYFALIYLVERRWPISRLTRRLLSAETNRFAALRRVESLKSAAKRIGELERRYAEYEAARFSTPIISRRWRKSALGWFGKPSKRSPLAIGQFLLFFPFKIIGFLSGSLLSNFFLPPVLSSINRDIDRMQQGIIQRGKQQLDMEEGLIYRLSRSKHYQSIFDAMIPKLGIIPIPSWQPYDSFMQSKVTLTFAYFNKITDRISGLQHVLSGKRSERTNNILLVLTVTATLAAIFSLFGIDEVTPIARSIIGILYKLLFMPFGWISDLIQSLSNFRK